jgi:hypothetical protein
LANPHIASTVCCIKQFPPKNEDDQPCFCTLVAITFSNERLTAARDCVADHRTANGTANGGRGFTFARTDLTAGQSARRAAYHRAASRKAYRRQNEQADDAITPRS